MTETENLKLTMDAPSEAYSVERVNANMQKLDDFAGAVNTALSEKQGTLTFDSTPTESSINPVTSGGVYDALALKVDAAAVTIPSGADMDTYTAAGSYISTSSATTGTLLHIPQGVSGKGFALDVQQTAANAVVQCIACMQVSTSQPRVFYRGGRNADGWAFGAWYEVTMAAEA